jgi:hypothetical protein
VLAADPSFNSSLITTRSRGKAYINPKRQRGMPQVSCGATPAPSLTLRVGMWDDSRSELGPASAGFPGGLQREVSNIPNHFDACLQSANDGEKVGAKNGAVETGVAVLRLRTGSGWQQVAVFEEGNWHALSIDGGTAMRGQEPHS